MYGGRHQESNHLHVGIRADDDDDDGGGGGDDDDGVMPNSIILL